MSGPVPGRSHGDGASRRGWVPQPRRSGEDSGAEPPQGAPTAGGFLPGELVYLALVTATGRAGADGTLTFPQPAGNTPLIMVGTRSGTLLVLGGQ